MWALIKDYENYSVNKNGDVKNNETGKILKQRQTKSGYKRVGLCKNKKQRLCSVHRIVATAFIVNTDNNLQVNHKNGKRDDNRLENLEWCTVSENMKHSYRELNRAAAKPMLGKTGINNPLSKKIKQINIKNAEVLNIFCGTHEASRITGIDQSNITKAVLGKQKTAGGFKWRYVIDCAEFTAPPRQEAPRC